jgi:hypothetical protein
MTLSLFAWSRHYAIGPGGNLKPSACTRYNGDVTPAVRL